MIRQDLTFALMLIVFTLAHCASGQDNAPVVIPKVVSDLGPSQNTSILSSEFRTELQAFATKYADLRNQQLESEAARRMRTATQLAILAADREALVRKFFADHSQEEQAAFQAMASRLQLAMARHEFEVLGRLARAGESVTQAGNRARAREEAFSAKFQADLDALRESCNEMQKKALELALAYVTGGASVLGSGASSDSRPGKANSTLPSSTDVAPSTQPSSDLTGSVDTYDSPIGQTLPKVASDTSQTRGKKVYDKPIGPPQFSPPPYSPENPEPGLGSSIGIADLIPIGKVASSAKGLASRIGQKLGWTKKAGAQLASPSTLSAVGRRGSNSAAATGAKEFAGAKPLSVWPGTNSPAKIAGRSYSGHALDRMQERGFVSSVIENTIEAGQKSAGTHKGTLRFFDAENNVTVIIDELTGGVVTVY